MTSQFDTDVRNRRNRTPWAHMSAKSFMTEMMYNGAPKGKDDHPTAVAIQVIYRPDVASRQWWTITWPSESGERLEASAQELELALWRAAEMELSRRQARAEKAAMEAVPERMQGPEGLKGTASGDSSGS